MKTDRLHPQSLLLGAAAAVVALGLIGSRSPQKPTVWEFKVTDRHNEKILSDLGKEGWDYAGYFGASKLGGYEVRTAEVTPGFATTPSSLAGEANPPPHRPRRVPALPRPGTGLGRACPVRRVGEGGSPPWRLPPWSPPPRRQTRHSHPSEACRAPRRRRLLAVREACQSVTRLGSLLNHACSCPSSRRDLYPQGVAPASGVGDA